VSSLQHIRQWKHNREFLAIIDPQFPDWAVTATFYVALHAVDALLKFDNVPGIVSHETRNSVLIRSRRYDHIWKHYRPLHDLSRTVRYLADPSRWIAWNQLETSIFRRYLYPIEQSVQKLLAQDIGLTAIALRQP